MEEKIRQDGLITCPHCGSSLCYAQKIDNEETWMCMACGYTSTTLMKEGSESEQKVTSRQPKLYKDLKFVDLNGYVWYPAVCTVPDKGMAYIDGSTLKDWEWVATPMRKVTSKERRSKKFFNQEYIADMKKTQKFGKNGFIEATTFVGMFERR